MAAVTANRMRLRRATHLAAIRTVVTTGSFQQWEGTLISVASNGFAAAAADTAGHRFVGVLVRATESSPGVEGACPAGTVLECEAGHEEWFPIGSGTFNGTVTQLDACALDNASLTTGTVAANDIRLGRIVELQTINGVAGAWIQVGVPSSGVT